MPRKPIVETSPRRWRTAAVVLITLALVAGVLFAINWFGSEALSQIGPRDRYRVPFADIQCDTPPGLDQHTFLAEVRYVASFPDSFNALEVSEREKLSQAFAAHPWVQSVEGIAVEPGNAVIVRLTFRVPVLAARVDRGAVRLVDGHGVLLPEAEYPRGVAELLNIVPAPTSPAGQVWPDETVQRAIDLVKAYQPRTLEFTDKEWRLVQSDGKTMTVAR